MGAWNPSLPDIIDTTTEGIKMEISLEGRVARCLSCTRESESSQSLPFFQFNGEGSERAIHNCSACGYSIVTHMELNPTTGRPGQNYSVHEFVPRGDTQDTYYCGCRGWD